MGSDGKYIALKGIYILKDLVIYSLQNVLSPLAFRSIHRNGISIIDMPIAYRNNPHHIFGDRKLIDSATQLFIIHKY